jgi:hypothetical protein
VPIAAVRAALVALERRGLAEHREGRWRRRQVGGDGRSVPDRDPSPG